MEVLQSRNTQQIPTLSQQGEHSPKPQPSLLVGATRAGQQPTGRMKEIYENVLYCIEDKRIYLDTHLSLGKFARLLYTNTTYLSKVINTFWGCNLKTLLNRYRIEHAKRLLVEERCDFHTLPARSGFASKSTFYTAFMKYEHTKPADYRYTHLKGEIRKKIDIEIENSLFL
jgi:YesN/AraC family two-component response regulator